MVWRVIEGEDGSLKVEVLKEEAWLPGRIGLVGLRLAPSTTKLNARAIRGLPRLGSSWAPSGRPLRRPRRTPDRLIPQARMRC